ncbi:MAG: hypothetical protein Kow0022_03500 [Phycisphaerales bacterium]
MRKILLVLIACSIPAWRLHAAPPDDHRMDWFRQARFGMFIHWGLYSIPAGEWNENTGHGEWIRTTAQIPIDQYDRLLHQFNPLRFAPDAWVQIAKDAGMNYIVITTKHHDGFALFDSRVSDFDVMATPFHRDIMAELADACRRHGIRIGWYYSIMDWHHPDYLPRRNWELPARPVADADFDRYLAFLHAQVTELLTNYGPVGIMWFDGEWESTWNHTLGQALYDLCRSLQPDVIVNNRVDVGRRGMAGISDPGFAGDFGTPEQEVPPTGIPGVDWETCMTMNSHWGWNRHDADWKSTQDLIRLLVDVASKGGNLLLNVGPRPDGTFPPQAVRRLREIGDWMDVHSPAIYGTTASPFPHLDWGRATARVADDASTLYLHVFDWPHDHSLVVPNLGNDIRSATLLTDGNAPLSWHRTGTDVLIDLPPLMPDERCTVVALEIQGRPLIYETPAIEAPADQFVDAAIVTLRTHAPLAIRFTIDGSDPGPTSPLYREPIRLDRDTTIKARAFHRDQPVSGVAARTFRKVTPWPSRPSATAPGLVQQRFTGSFDALPDFRALRPSQTAIIPTVALPPGFNDEYVALLQQGMLRVDQDALYVFSLTSDDGARLWIDDHLVIDNDGLHTPVTVTGTAPLAAGSHAFRIEWFNKTGGLALDLKMAKAGQPLHPIAPDRLTHAIGDQP